ncbi:PIG-L family deacetylase [Candidatus Woesearchaeota archaeon]|nr:PIG-L family deacetylase [Candidatus Woesearchaeota archaeon]
MKNIIIFCAHGDDELIGLGGTILKYSKKYNIIKVIFSSGEKSSPHLKESHIIGERINESEKIGRKAGIKENIYFHLMDRKLQEFSDDEGILNQTKDVIGKYKPAKIFTLTSVDPHPDHRAVNKITMNAIKDIKYSGEVYGYEVWNIIKLNEPAIYEDITPFMNKKIQLMREFKSQWMYIYTLILPTYLRAFINGRKIKARYAERFFKLK